MRLPPCLRQRSSPVTPQRHEPSEATMARIQAEADLARTKAQTPIYRALGASLREMRERNHIREAFELTIQKGHPS